MSKPTVTFYLLHGDDDFSLEQALTNLRGQMGEGANADLNMSEFDGQAASPAEILNAVCSYPFLADKRMAVVKGMIGHITRKGAGETGKKAVEQLMSALPTLPEWARLVFVERGALSDSNRIVKLAKEQSNGFEKAFNTPQDSTGWIMKRAKDEYGVEIEPRAASALAMVTQNDLRRADNELVKLASFTAGAAIKEADVDLLTPYLAEARIFDMVDAMAEGRAGQALAMLHRLLMEKDEDPIRTYGMIVRQFRLLLSAKDYLVSGGYPNKMAESLKMSPYVAKKMASQSRAFSLPQLDELYRRLLDYDIKMKTGQIKPDLALDLFIAALA